MLGEKSIKSLETKFKAIKQFKENIFFSSGALNNLVVLIPVLCIILVVIIPVIFVEFYFSDPLLAAFSFSFIYFIMGLSTYLASQKSQYENSFRELKWVLWIILKCLESDDFKSKIAEIGIDSALFTGLNEFNKLLKRDGAKLSLGFIRNYVSMLKTFGSKDMWEDFCLTLFDILKEYETFNVTTIASLFVRLEEQFEDLKKRIPLAEISPNFFQNLVLFIKIYKKEIIFGVIVPAIFLVLSYIGFR